MAKNKTKKPIWLDESIVVFPKKFYSKEEAQEELNRLEQPTGEEFIEWRNKFSDEEFERRYGYKKSGNFKIKGEGYIRYKKAYEEPDYFGEVWSDEPYMQPYFTDKLGKGAMPVWACEYNAYWDVQAYFDFCDEKKK